MENFINFGFEFRDYQIERVGVIDTVFQPKKKYMY